MKESQLLSARARAVNEGEGWNIDLMRKCIEPRAKVALEQALFQQAFSRTFLAADALKRLEEWMQKDVSEAARQRLADHCQRRIEAVSCDASKKALRERLDRVGKPAELNAV
ncbi:MAG: hypothetical protein Greene041662_83 [Candidatus Peregrinibacteria bacterium Greene0416_62]|nr:MAG: hypothetical protein Greene041662_83 [Candidatus Peregrinibacteria bacterium Greene0416_62]TSC97069.1 MAG: hypothetical protein Greene101449_1308 [Candidatus Peregrinibacteria bacterium Greene1014_49]